MPLPVSRTAVKLSFRGRGGRLFKYIVSEPTAHGEEGEVLEEASTTLSG